MHNHSPILPFIRLFIQSVAAYCCFLLAYSDQGKCDCRVWDNDRPCFSLTFKQEKLVLLPVLADIQSTSFSCVFKNGLKAPSEEFT